MPSKQSDRGLIRTLAFIGIGTSGLSLSLYAGQQYGNLAGAVIAVLVMLFVSVYSIRYSPVRGESQ